MKCYNNVNKKIYNFMFINNKIEGVKYEKNTKIITVAVIILVCSLLKWLSRKQSKSERHKETKYYRRQTERKFKS